MKLCTKTKVFYIMWITVQQSWIYCAFLDIVLNIKRILAFSFHSLGAFLVPIAISKLGDNKIYKISEVVLMQYD